MLILRNVYYLWRTVANTAYSHLSFNLFKNPKRQVQQQSTEMEGNQPKAAKLVNANARIHTQRSSSRVCPLNHFYVASLILGSLPRQSPFQKHGHSGSCHTITNQLKRFFWHSINQRTTTQMTLSKLCNIFKRQLSLM